MFQFMPFQHRLTAERHRIPRGRSTVPHPPHTAAQGVIGERKGPNAKLGERGASKGALPGTACSVPGKGADFRPGREGFPTLSEAFPSRYFCSCPLFEVFQLYGRRFLPGMEHYHPPRGYFFVSPDIWPSGRASGSVPTGQWFKPSFFCFFVWF